MSLVVKQKIKTISDPRGELLVAEVIKDIPFEVKRVYFLQKLKVDLDRGFHAHKKLRQVMVCLNGQCEVLLDDGKTKEKTLLKASESLLIDAKIWHVMSHFSENCVLAVFASDFYDEADYLREYEDFLSFVKLN